MGGERPPELPRIRAPEEQPDAYYRLLVESITDYAIFLLDPEGRVASWNLGAERVSGYRAEEAIGRHYRAFFPEEEQVAKRPEAQLETAAREGRVEGEGWRVRRDGSRVWAHFLITALYEGGQLAGYGKVTEDLTKLRQALTELRTREKQLAEAQEIAHIGSWEWDLTTDRVHWSREMFQIYGIESPSPLDYHSYLELIHPADRETVRQAVQQAVDTGKPFVHQHRILRLDGELRWIQGRGEASRSRSGRVIRMHGTSLDITELKQAQERNERLAAEQLARAHAERTAQRMEFLAEASSLVGASLDYTEALGTVAWLAVPSFADWCTVDMAGPDGHLERLALAHADPDRVALARKMHERYPPDPEAECGVYAVLRSGEPELMTDIPQEMLVAATGDEDHRRLVQQLGLRSSIAVPIRVRDHTLGVISFINAESDRRYDADDLIVAEELAGRAALAIENAQLHAAEREARWRAEQATDRIGRLQSITAGLSEAVTPEAVASVIVDAGAGALNASTGSLILTIDEPPGYRIVRSIGFNEETLDELRKLGEKGQIPIATAIRERKLVIVSNPEERDERYPALNTMAEKHPYGAVAAVPLRSGDSILGGLSFTYEKPREFTAGDREFLLAIARQCAQALERSRLYEDEHTARETAEAASRAKSQFVAMMSHELRTPLAAIIGYQELLAEEIAGPVNEKQREQLSRIRASATHLRDLINQILSLSRIEAGKEEVFLEEVDLAALVRDVAVLMEREVSNKGLSFVVRIPDEPFEARTDPGKVRQILLNLLSNSIKFTERGEVGLEFTAFEESVRIRVRDTGIGIPEADRQRVFDAFTQVDQSMTRRAGGTGLGLPVSRHLARLLGGEVALESQPEEEPGSTFTLTLPRTAPEPMPAEEAGEKRPAPDRAKGSE